MDNWAAAEFMGAMLPNQRFLGNLIACATALECKRGVSYSVAVGDSGRQSLRRLLRNKRTTMEGLLKGHIQQTAARCVGNELVIAPQDTTTLDYTTHYALEGTGPISTSKRPRGILLHTAMAVTTEGEPVGVLHMHAWERNAMETPKKDSRRELPTSEKESDKWIRGMKGIESALPATQPVLIVGDSESDVYDLLAEPRRRNTHLLIRSCQKRRVRIAADEPDIEGALSLLDAAVNAAPICGEIRVTIPRKGAKPEREATMHVRFLSVDVQPPLHGVRPKTASAVRVSVVEVTEVSPPKDEEPLRWRLFTTMPVADFETACLIIRYYTLRWKIEQFHFALKSGCMNVERLQIDNLAALKNALTLYAVLAWRALYVTYISRVQPDEPAITILSETELLVLRTVSKRTVDTVADAIREIAILAGHPRYAKAPPPGIKRVCMGIMQLQAMAYGWELRQHHENNEPR